MDRGSLTYVHSGCVPYTQRGVRHKQVSARVDSEGLKTTLTQQIWNLTLYHWATSPLCKTWNWNSQLYVCVFIRVTCGERKQKRMRYLLANVVCLVPWHTHEPGSKCSQTSRRGFITLALHRPCTDTAQVISFLSPLTYSSIIIILYFMLYSTSHQLSQPTYIQ